MRSGSRPYKEWLHETPGEMISSRGRMLCVKEIGYRNKCLWGTLKYCLRDAYDSKSPYPKSEAMRNGWLRTGILSYWMKYLFYLYPVSMNPYAKLNQGGTAEDHSVPVIGDGMVIFIFQHFLRSEKHGLSETKADSLYERITWGP